MAHFAKIVDGIVTEVIVVDTSDILDADGNESEAIGKTFCTNLFGGNWVQTSYNGTFRKNYAAVGHTYSEQLDGFIPPSPYPSWTLNEETCVYDPPIPRPVTDEYFQWDETNQEWSIGND